MLHGLQRGSISGVQTPTGSTGFLESLQGDIVSAMRQSDLQRDLEAPPTVVEMALDAVEEEERSRLAKEASQMSEMNAHEALSELELLQASPKHKAVQDDLAQTRHELDASKEFLFQTQRELSVLWRASEVREDLDKLLAGQLSEEIGRSLGLQEEVQDLKDMLEEQFELQQAAPLRWAQGKSLRETMDAHPVGAPSPWLQSKAYQGLTGRSESSVLEPGRGQRLDPSYPMEAAPGALFLSMLEHSGIYAVTPVWEAEELKGTVKKLEGEVRPCETTLP